MERARPLGPRPEPEPDLTTPRGRLVASIPETLARGGDPARVRAQLLFVGVTPDEADRLLAPYATTAGGVDLKERAAGLGAVVLGAALAVPAAQTLRTIQQGRDPRGPAGRGGKAAAGSLGLGLVAAWIFAGGVVKLLAGRSARAALVVTVASAAAVLALVGWSVLR